MNKANQLYWQAKSYKQTQQDISYDFLRECLKEFEKDAVEGSFSAIIYNDNIPESIVDDFDDLVVPLFEEEGFKVKRYYSPNFTSCDGWEISWNLKEGEIQYE